MYPPLSYPLFPKQIYLNGVLTVCLRTRWVSIQSATRCPHQLLCAGCGLGDTCCRLVYAKWSLMPLWLKKHKGFDTLCLPDPSRHLSGPKAYFRQKYPYARKGVYPLFRHFSNTCELSEFLCERFGYDWTDFSRPRPKRIRQSGDMQDLD